MVKLGAEAICACGHPVAGEPGPDGTVPCGACGRGVVLDASRAAQAFGTSESTPTTSLESPTEKPAGQALSDSTGEPFKIALETAGVTPDGLTQSVSPVASSGGSRPATTVPVPERLGPYRVLGRLGEGGMGIVYKGHDDALDRAVALKVLSRAHGPDGQLAGIEQEARSIAAVAHPNVVQVYAAGEQDGLAYFAMEFVRGPDLREVLEREGPLSVERARKAMAQAATGLRAAARKGIFHRDVKPANLLVDELDDQVKVADFGLAKRACVDASLGGTSLIAGTPLYVAPEVIRDGSGDHRADIYPLGAAFFHLLAGSPPFGGRSVADALVGHAKLEAPDVRSVRADVPEGLARTIGRCLEKDPAARFQTYDELLASLGRPLTPSSERLPVVGTTDAPVVHVQPHVAAAPAPLPVVAATRPAGTSFAWKRWAHAARRAHRQAVPGATAAFERAVRRRPRRVGGGAILALLGVAWVGTSVLGGALRPPASLAEDVSESEPSTPPGPPTFHGKALPPWYASASKIDEHEFTALRPIVQMGLGRVERDSFAPITVERLLEKLPWNGGFSRIDVPRTCRESRLPYAIVGPQTGSERQLIAWHIHDGRARTVRLLVARGDTVSWTLDRFLHWLRDEAEKSRKSWPDVVGRLRPFLPPSVSDEELLLDDR